MRVVVQGESMAPRIVAGQRLFASRIAYCLGRPSGGDVVVIRKAGGRLLVKRIVAGPRDCVRWCSGRVDVNGRSSYRRDVQTAERPPKPSAWILGPDEYFVLGEDPRGSWDSCRFGPVHRREIAGKVIGCYWPPDRWGLLSGRP